jgi:hypothetical protein
MAVYLCIHFCCNLMLHFEQYIRICRHGCAFCSCQSHLLSLVQSRFLFLEPSAPGPGGGGGYDGHRGSSTPPPPPPPHPINALLVVKQLGFCNFCTPARVCVRSDISGFHPPSPPTQNPLLICPLCTFLCLQYRVDVFPKYFRSSEKFY